MRSISLILSSTSRLDSSAASLSDVVARLSAASFSSSLVCGDTQQSLVRWRRSHAGRAPVSCRPMALIVLARLSAASHSSFPMYTRWNLIKPGVRLQKPEPARAACDMYTT